MTEPTLTDIVTGPRVYLTPEEFDEAVALYAEGAAVDEPVTVTAPPAPVWEPKDEAAADWAAARLRALNDELREVTGRRNEMHDQVDEWYDRRTRQAKHRAAFLEAALQRFALRWQAEDPKRRTLPLPEGSLLKVTVPKARRIDVESEIDVLRWARSMDYGDVINTTPDAVYVSAVRQRVEAREVDGVYRAIDKRTGEIVAGLVVRDPADRKADVAL